jgi:hypothetical protein
MWSAFPLGLRQRAKEETEVRKLRTFERPSEELLIVLVLSVDRDVA